MTKVFGHLSPDTDATGSAIIWAWYLNEHTSQEAEAFVLGELNSETAFVLNRWNIDTPKLLGTLNTGEDVVIVDTNNPQELPENINEMNIVQILDHHKLVGGLETIGPVDITMRPLACTATVLFDQMGEAITALPDNIAGQSHRELSFINLFFNSSKTFLDSNSSTFNAGICTTVP